MQEGLLNFNLSNWVGALLSGIPALLNLGIFIYTFFALPKKNISYLFSVFVFVLVGWQMCDTFTRLSATRETAEIWTKIMYLSALMITPLGLHFSILYTGKEKLAKSFPFLFLLYLPAAFIIALLSIGKNESVLEQVPVFGWVLSDKVSTTIIFESVWIALLGIIMFSVLLSYAIEKKNNPQKRKQSLLLAIGFAIPTLQGTFTQVLFPDFLGLHEIPITSTFMTLFSVAALIALKKFKLFYISPTITANTIVETLTDALFIISKEVEILLMNPAARSLLGIKEMEPGLVKLQTIMVHESWFNFNKQIAFVLANKTSIVNHQATLVSVSGRKIPVLISITSLPGEADSEALLMLAHDIAENRKAEERLKLTQYAVDNAQEAIFWLHPDDSFFYANDFACHLLGYDRAELMHMSIYDIEVFGLPKSSWVKSWQEIAEKHTLNMVAKVRKKDGTVFLMEIAATYLKYENYSFKVVHAVDISEKMAHAEEITKQKELYESLVNAQSDMGEGVCVTEEYKIIYANNALCEIYGYTREELYKLTSYMDIIPEQEAKTLTNRLKQRISGDISETMATRIKRKDGKVIDIEYSVKILRSEEKLRMISIIRGLPKP